jgi:hypothetical protein
VLLKVPAACICFHGGAAESYETPVHVLKPPIDNDGPWSIRRYEFDNLLNKDFNGTGIFPVAGPNISAPSSVTTSIDGWSWSIFVVADIPIINSSWEIPQKSQFYTWGKLTFNAPQFLHSSSSSSVQNVSVNDDWQICLYSWDLGFGDAPYPSNLRNDDGTCSSVLSS